MVPDLGFQLGELFRVSRLHTQCKFGFWSCPEVGVLGVTLHTRPLPGGKNGHPSARPLSGHSWTLGTLALLFIIALETKAPMGDQGTEVRGGSDSDL